MNFFYRRAFKGMDHGFFRCEDAGVFGDHPFAKAEDKDITRLHGFRRDFNEMGTGCFDQRFTARCLCPVAAIGCDRAGRALVMGLINTAYQAEAIAANAFDALLVMIRGADPASGQRDDVGALCLTGDYLFSFDLSHPVCRRCAAGRR